ncbi:MAG: thymidine phosphorylase [Bacillota bacterium]|nr:thymidine phosphorylase [Bacillota bacterium]
MNIIQIINRKKYKENLSQEEINFFVQGLVSGSVKDYQASSLLMAILLNGMSLEETSLLTKAMVDSGGQVDLSSIPGTKVDKHSTGGVGDKVSLALVPLLASCGLKVAKMSGKGLGHTGGTLDKLESIPGLKIELEEKNFIQAVKDYDAAIISQTDNLVPADKILYALRDVSGTIDSIPLIASSIMSKKLASGADTIFLDVKVGRGAFMKDLDSATSLAETMVYIGKSYGKDTQVIISDMNQPLGLAIGNSLELIEAIETLKGQGPKDFESLVLTAGSIILKQAGLEMDQGKGEKLLKEKISDGSALKALKKLILGQGGDPELIDDYKKLPIASAVTEVLCPEDGYIEEIDPLELGLLSADLGAGRKVLGDKIDHGSGFVLRKKVGDFVEKDQPLLSIYHNKDLDKDFVKKVLAAYKFTKEKCPPRTLVYKHIS